MLGNPREYIRECASSIYYDFKTPADITDWVNYTGAGESSIVNNVLKIGSNAGNDQQWIVHKDLIPIEKDTLYKVSAKVRRTHGTGVMYIGIAGVKEDKTSLCNIAGHNTHSSQHYPVASLSPASAFTEYAGYFSTNNNLLSNYYRKRVLHPNVVYVRPLLIANYPNKVGITEIEWFKIEKITSDTDDLTKNKITSQTHLQVNSIKAGATSVPLSFPKLNATFPNATNLTLAIPHGLERTKIKGVHVTVDTGTQTAVPNMPVNGLHFWIADITATHIVIKHKTTANTASSLYGKPVTVIVTYEN